MFYHQAKLTYQGCTIILSNASRFDTTELLSGNSGLWFTQKVLRDNGVNRYQLDICDLEGFNRTGRKLREGTRVCLLLGEQAQRSVTGVDTTLGEQRGSPIIRDGIVYISSYPPVECFDLVNHESRLNPRLNGELPAPEGYTNEEDDGEDEGNGKTRHGKTARGNYRFWLTRDVSKALRILKHGMQVHQEPEYNIYPSSQEVIDSLTNHSNEDFYLDIETDSDLNITCFGYSFGNESMVYVVPLLRYDYSPAYSNLGAIMRALCKAMHSNTTVSHNGSGFDWFVIPFKYGIPFGRSLYDTMVAAHRCYPEIEKSLGHVISLYTDLPYHKDEGIFEPQSREQEQKLWMYNGKDVYAMREVKKGITKYASTVVGLPESIEQANASIRPYLTTTLQGIRYNESEVESLLKINDRILNGLLRLCTAAVGSDILEELRGNGKSSLLGSPDQCVKYFHGLCGYPVVSYGKVRKDGTRRPSLDEKNFLKLVQKLTDKGIENPVVDLVLGYRGVAKESSMLKFEPWPGIKQLR